MEYIRTDQTDLVLSLLGPHCGTQGSYYVQFGPKMVLKSLLDSHFRSIDMNLGYFLLCTMPIQHNMGSDTLCSGAFVLNCLK